MPSAELGPAMPRANVSCRAWQVGQRQVVSAAGALVVWLGLACWGPGSTVGAAGAAQAPERPLSYLRVGPAGGPAGLAQILDDHDRQVLLKGVNVDGLVDYYRPDLKTPYPTDPAAYSAGRCPPDDPSVEGVMVCDFDLAQMRPLGFNVVRLNLSWSLLEPNPGQISAIYLARIAQVVSWARAQGIYVVLDVHQDAWSKYVYTQPGQSCAPPFQSIRGYDGAPAWASQHSSPACALNGVRELDPAVQEQFQKLYSNTAAPDGVGLQEHYAHMVSALAARFAGEPAVAGYELINEPSPGFNAVPSGMDATELFPFYGKVVNTVLRDLPGFRQLFFIEPNTERDITDQSAIVTPWSAYSSYPNVVYAPHIYTGVFTVDQQAASRRFFPSDGGYNSAISDAKALGLPLWVGEFGNNPADDETLLRTSYSLQDRDGLGGALWLWKENANDVNGSVFWGVYGKPFGQGVPQPRRIKFVARAFPLLTAGTLQSFVYDADGQTFDMRANSGRVSAGDRSRATVIFVPAASTFDIHAEGADLEVLDRGPSREVYVFPRGGPYHVFESPRAPGAGRNSQSLLSIDAPPTQSCRSRRRLTIHLRAHPGAHLVQVRVYLNGRRVRGAVSKRRRRIDLRGLPRGTFHVRLAVRLRQDGHLRTVSSTRTYHTCGRRHHRRRHAVRR